MVLNCTKWIVLLTLLYSQFLFAANLPTIVTTVSGSIAHQGHGSTQTLWLTPVIEKKYPAHSASHLLTQGDIFLGILNNLNSQWQSQVGLDFASSSHAIMSGSIWDDAEATFNNYKYRYFLHHSHIVLEAKLLANMHSILPWVSAGIGMGFNRSHSFSNTPTIPEAIASPNFTSHTLTTLSYIAGMGFQYPLSQHWQLGMGYEFANWGRSRLGKASGQTTNRHLALSHFYTNAIDMNATYILC